MLYANCKVKCVRYRSYERRFTVGKIYECKNGLLPDDIGYVYEPLYGKSPVKWLKDWYDFEIIECEDLVCEICGEKITGNNFLDVRGHIVCDSCKEDNVVFCEICNRAELVENMHYYDDVGYCSICFRQEFSECVCCGEIVPNDEIFESAHGDIICEECRYEYYYECEECGDLIHVDYVRWVEDGDVALCADCYEEQYEKVIKRYNYKPNPIMYGDELFRMGIELEIDNGGESHTNAQTLIDVMNDDNEHIYIKHDGSIYDGFEIVSHPATIEYHVNNMNWQKLMEKALSMQYRSHDTDTCGLHIHVSKNALGETYDDIEHTISKIIYFIENNWNEVLRFTRRTESNLRRWASRYGIEEDIEKTYKKAKGDYNRYRCINLQNDNTIEFRMFRGTLKYSTFVATLQLVYMICMVCKNNSADRIAEMKWHDFVEFIDPTRYSELIDYLKIRNLYTNI